LLLSALIAIDSCMQAPALRTIAAGALSSNGAAARRSTANIHLYSHKLQLQKRQIKTGKRHTTFQKHNVSNAY